MSSPPSQRLQSLDWLRGLTMFFLLLEHASISRYASSSDFSLLRIIGEQFTHSHWLGIRCWDMIQPLFMFMVGVAVPWMIQNRLKRGESHAKILSHAVKRSLIFIALGIFLRSLGYPETQWTFEDVVTQIGLGYTALVAINFLRLRWQITLTTTLLLSYWAWFATYPGTPLAALAGQETTSLQGFAAHWNNGANPAHAFDVWFLNLFPRSHPFLYHPGGYMTLNAIPSTVTMLLGSLVGTLLKSEKLPQLKLRILTFASLACILAGLSWSASGTCPLIKPLWTPSWTLLSGGIAIAILTLAYSLIDLRKILQPSAWIVALGKNSILVYIMSSTTIPFIDRNLHTHLHRYLAWLGNLEPVSLGALSIFLAIWLTLALHRKGLHIRI